MSNLPNVPNPAANTTPLAVADGNLAHPADATFAAPGQGAAQQAITILMATNLSPYMMANQFIQAKEAYLAQTYGVTIGQ